MDKHLAVAVVGPTASGKTSLAIEIAKRLGGEIVSADSMQIYKKMNIATAKPTDEELSAVRHHLIDIIDADEEFSVAMYKERALASMKDIVFRGKLPIIVGGTGLYVDTLVNNTEFLDYEKSDIRAELEAKAEQEGTEALFEELRRIDEATWRKLHVNDTKRIIRALEVYYSTGKTITEQKENSHLIESEYKWCIIGLNAKDRQFLYDRINMRVDMMLEEGLVSEARDFFASSISATAKQAIGYKELKPYFDGEASLEEATQKLKMETRRYAKRQLTWFRKNDKINWLYIDSLSSSELADKAEETIKIFLGD